MVLEKKMNLIQILEQEEMARVTAGKTIPSFRAGDTVVVNVNVVEGSPQARSGFERRDRPPQPRSQLFLHRPQDLFRRRR